MAPRLGATDLRLYRDNRIQQALCKPNNNAIDSAMVRRDARTHIALRRDPYGNLSAQQTGDLSRQGDRARGDDGSIVRGAPIERIGDAVEHLESVFLITAQEP